MDDNNNKKEKTKKRRSVFTQSDELEKRLEAAKRRAATDRDSLTAQNATDELTHQLLTKALKEMFEKTDKLQGGSFIHGSMARLSADMWKGVTK